MRAYRNPHSGSVVGDCRRGSLDGGGRKGGERQAGNGFGRGSGSESLAWRDVES